MLRARLDKSKSKSKKKKKIVRRRTKWAGVTFSSTSVLSSRFRRERETMLSAEMRQRRPKPATEAGSSSDRYTDESRDHRRRDNVGEAEDKGLRWFLPLLVLGCLRHMSATSNIIHDCDEVFNYWEPLHYVLYKSGFQTWEYRFVPFFFSFHCSTVTQMDTNNLYINWILILHFILFPYLIWNVSSTCTLIKELGCNSPVLCTKCWGILHLTQTNALL